MDSTLRTPESRFSTMMSSLMPTDSKGSGSGIQLVTLNTISVLISITILVVLNQIYLIFLPSIKALVWALLLGSALFRYKYDLRNQFDAYFDSLDSRQQTLTLGLSILPFKLISHIWSYSLRFLDDHRLFFIVFHFRHQILSMFSVFGSIFVAMLIHNKGIFTAVVVIVLLSQFYLTFRDSSSIFNFMPSIISLVALYLFGTFGYVLFSFIFFYISIGLCITVYDFFHNILKEDLLTLSSLNLKLQTYVLWFRNKFLADDSIDGPRIGDIGKLYMSMLFTLFFFITIEHLQLSNAIFLVYLAAKLIEFILNLAIVKLVMNRILELANFFQESIGKDSFYKTIAHFFFKGDQFFLRILHESIDLISTISVLSIVVVLITFASTFLTLKVYNEFSMVVTFIQTNDYTVDNIKTTIAQVSSRFVKLNLNSTQVGEESNLVLMMINTIEKIDWQGSIESRQSNGTGNAQAILSNPMFKSIEDNFPFINLRSLVLKVEHVFDFVQSRNISYMPFVKTLLLAFNSFLFAILDSSSLLFNFLLNTIVFCLALFYLLSTSKAKYKPIEIMDDIINSLLTDMDSSRLSLYVEEVITSIFAATLKISVFYFLHTWLLYSLFSLPICYIPSVVASILAAVPFPLPAYSASIPGAIVIYYFDTHFNLVKSIAFFIIAIIPSLVVDSSIYSGIKRSIHPYLISISITSGVVYFGVEGAVFGPLFLSLVFIIVNMATSLAENKLNSP